ncbi:hypothetical protein BUALT_Bualt10G0041400 [Buddleja alternifolia]|uniref:F-box domain-containing protein n=1 Tax=Buddleja alternifolia TaxID=168488 RepID=A0AAV6WVY6_9LAMI|nr:hypothetical protein BUALT_Bualt10G0041400 [Buddleja alternifolia]
MDHEEPPRQVPKMVVSQSLTDLPQNTILEILARLPLKALYASRCVCKTFLNLSSPNPQFIALHSSSNASQALVIQFGDDVKPSKFLRWIDPEIDVARGRTPYFRLKPIFEVPEIWRRNMNIYRTNIRYENEFVVVNSCNGLLYIAKQRSSSDERSVVCNPVTNEYVMVPNVDMRNKPLSETRMMMLGYTPGTNQYKVLRIFYTTNGEDLEVRAQVHVVGSSSWRDIEDRPLGIDHSWDACPFYLNGAIYWLSYLEMFTVVISFDFERERFDIIMLPPEFGEEQLRNKNGLGIGVLRDRLCVTNNVYNHHLDIWIMKKHDNEECWSKEFVIDTERPMGRRFYGQLRPLQVLSNGEIVMLWLDIDVVCYDPKNKSLKLVGFNWPRLHPKVVGFTPNFVPLKDTLLVDKVMVQYVRPSGDEMDL